MDLLQIISVYFSLHLGIVAISAYPHHRLPYARRTPPMTDATDSVVSISSEPTPFQAPSSVKITDDAENIPSNELAIMDDRTWQTKSYRKTLLNNVFQIPIQTLMAVNNLVQAILGGQINDLKPTSNNNNEIAGTNALDLYGALINAKPQTALQYGHVK